MIARKCFEFELSESKWKKIGEKWGNVTWQIAQETVRNGHSQRTFATRDALCQLLRISESNNLLIFSDKKINLMNGIVRVLCFSEMEICYEKFGKYMGCYGRFHFISYSEYCISTCLKNAHGNVPIKILKFRDIPIFSSASNKIEIEYRALLWMML